ncbi:MAG TPA: hypothetical protein VME46_22895 [Acidimicrobiales bacterium]|nr:hypothetical protein [Acidimicrobiales bacterium]
MANSKSSTNDGVLHIVAGAIAAGVSHILVPIRNWFDYVVRAVVGALLSALVLSALRAA